MKERERERSTRGLGEDDESTKKKKKIFIPEIDCIEKETKRNKNRTNEFEEEECQKRPSVQKSFFPKHDNIISAWDDEARADEYERDEMAGIDEAPPNPEVIRLEEFVVTGVHNAFRYPYFTAKYNLVKDSPEFVIDSKYTISASIRAGSVLHCAVRYFDNASTGHPNYLIREVPSIGDIFIFDIATSWEFQGVVRWFKMRCLKGGVPGSSQMYAVIQMQADPRGACFNCVAAPVKAKTDILVEREKKNPRSRHWQEQEIIDTLDLCMICYDVAANVSVFDKICHTANCRYNVCWPCFSTLAKQNKCPNCRGELLDGVRKRDLSAEVVTCVYCCGSRDCTCTEEKRCNEQAVSTSN